MNTKSCYYQKRDTENREQPKENEIRISLRRSNNLYINDVATRFLENKETNVLLKAIGNAIPSALLISDILRHRIKGLSLVQTIGNIQIKEDWIPKIEGLKNVTQNRILSSLELTLTTQPTAEEKQSVGFQGPLPDKEVQEYTLEQIRNFSAQVPYRRFQGQRNFGNDNRRDRQFRGGPSYWGNQNRNYNRSFEQDRRMAPYNQQQGRGYNKGPQYRSEQQRGPPPNYDQEGPDNRRPRDQDDGYNRGRGYNNPQGRGGYNREPPFNNQQGRGYNRGPPNAQQGRDSTRGPPFNDDQDKRYDNRRQDNRRNDQDRRQDNRSGPPQEQTRRYRDEKGDGEQANYQRDGHPSRGQGNQRSAGSQGQERNRTYDQY